MQTEVLRPHHSTHCSFQNSHSNPIDTAYQVLEVLQLSVGEAGHQGAVTQELQVQNPVGGARSIPGKSNISVHGELPEAAPKYTPLQFKRKRTIYIMVYKSTELVDEIMEPQPQPRKYNLSVIPIVFCAFFKL